MIVHSLIQIFFKAFIDYDPKPLQQLCYAGCLLIISGCSALSDNKTSSIAIDTSKLNIAQAYASTSNSSSDLKKINFVDNLKNIADKPKPLFKDGIGLRTNITLSHAITQALIDNHSIKEQRAGITKAQAQLTIVTSNQGFNLSLANTSSLQTNSQSTSANKNFDLSLKGSWNPDFWGDLSAQTKAAHLQLAQAKSNLQRTQKQLIADITSAWYQLIYQQKQFDLSISQQQNTGAQLAAIESAYSQGLNKSLDVYLARSNLENARSNSVARQQALSEASRKLELLFAVYPSGKLLLEGDLVQIEDKLNLGVPSDLLRNRADINSRWLSVLVEDANVASRYAQQFPQFSLTGNLSLTAARLSQLFKQNIAWSLIASVNQTLIDNGKKKALYNQAQATLIEQEQQYLSALKTAFSEVENLLDNNKTISEQWRLNKLSLLNAELSFEQINVQYQNGIANYQQVLDIQQQLFERQKSHLDFKINLIDNRINLLLALGNADFNVTQTPKTTPATTLKATTITEPN